MNFESSVFRAELFDPTKEGTKVIRVEDMEAPVFRALLTFIYTDALLEMDPKDEYAMAQHLLAAADRDSLQRRLALSFSALQRFRLTSSKQKILSI